MGNIDLTLRPSPRPGSMFMTRHYPIDVDLTKHLIVLGATGSGKSTLVKSLILNAIQRGLFNKIVVIDPHGHTAVLGRLINARIIDLSKGGIATNKFSIMIESVRMANPLLSIGVEGALLRMAGIGGDGITGINELVRRLDELSRNNLILKDAFYSLFNVLAPIINYYNGNTIMLDVDDLLNDDSIFMMGSITNNELIRYLAMLILLSISNKAISECLNPPCSLRYLVIVDEAHNVLKLPSELKILGLDDPVERMVRELRKSVWRSSYYFSHPLIRSMMESLAMLVLPLFYRVIRSTCLMWSRVLMVLMVMTRYGY